MMVSTGDTMYGFYHSHNGSRYNLYNRKGYRRIIIIISDQHYESKLGVPIVIQLYVNTFIFVIPATLHCVLLAEMIMLLHYVFTNVVIFLYVYRWQSFVMCRLR